MIINLIKKKIEEARGFYEIIDQINKFSDIVWFNRHKNREYQIMNGEIEVVSSEYAMMHTIQSKF